MKFAQIGFIGLGLIGGSIAKSIQMIAPETKIIALASRESTIKAAYQDGLIENDTFIAIEEFSHCDLIFLCSPVKVNVHYLKLLKDVIKPDCIITDVGSVKGDIHQAVIQLGMTTCFIGGHPMTGSEQIGYEHASAHLLENAYYILTTQEDFSKERLDEFAAFIKQLGAIPITLTPQMHDYATAAISHLPHIISASLVNLVQKADTTDELLKTIAAGGFRDITRISSSSPVMWEHICLTNQKEILHLIDLYMEQLNNFKEDIQKLDGDALISSFEQAKEYRDSLPIHKPGILPKVFEFYCDLIDEAGGIATIATILATNQLSIKNIGIINNREFSDGVLRIEMYDEASLNAATALLERNHYQIYIK